MRNNHQKFIDLRREYPFFEYQSYSFCVKNGSIEAEFCFNLSNRIIFRPSIIIPIRDFFSTHNIEANGLDNYIFHIGMVELISYWKAACPPKVIIRSHILNYEQVQWWKKLYYNGLGEFFYLNGIDIDQDSFMTIDSQGGKLNTSNSNLDRSKVLVPIGGGKDSVVTIELLKNSKVDVVPLVVNPREASTRTINIAGFTDLQSIFVTRKLDSSLLELNNQGFLNGHTPFSALLAFTGALCCFISGISNVALSNESSANESTVPGSNVNHQYSKSFEFEEDFNNYVKKYINKNINYFSFLRPLNELQIAKLFSKQPQHFVSFRSCNVGSKNDSWCGKCPKCLFTYIILSPFIETSKLEDIFDKNMLADISLEKSYNELTGIDEVKPFECVGTPDEVVAALSKVGVNNKSVFKPVKLNKRFVSFKKLINDYNTENLLPDEFESIIKDALDDRKI